VADREPAVSWPDRSPEAATGAGAPAAAPHKGTKPSARLRDLEAKLDTSGYVEQGRASWYGQPFHGRRAANGEIYDMYKMTAAHRTLPFETIVRVTNLVNGLSADVRITDRGPFVENRIIDLSRAAADAIDMVRAGVEDVRVVVISGGNPGTGYFTVQVGAFHDRERAEHLRERMLLNYSPVYIEKNASPLGIFYRVHVGKIFGEEAAREFTEQLRRDQEGLVTFVVRLDDESVQEELGER
jgi:rare lipoprotein A